MLTGKSLASAEHNQFGREAMRKSLRRGLVVLRRILKKLYPYAFLATLVLQAQMASEILPQIIGPNENRIVTSTFVGLSIIGLYFALEVLSVLYGGPLSRWWPREEPTSNLYLLTLVLLSVASCVLAFSSAYLSLSQKDNNSFSEVLTQVSSVYFSLVTFATVGYGDIAPESSSARILVSIEIIVSMFYTVLMFSVIAGFIRQNSVPPQSK
jgi:MFS family permease